MSTADADELTRQMGDREAAWVLFLGWLGDQGQYEIVPAQMRPLLALCEICVAEGRRRVELGAPQTVDSEHPMLHLEKLGLVDRTGEEPALEEEAADPGTHA